MIWNRFLVSVVPETMAAVRHIRVDEREGVPPMHNQPWFTLLIGTVSVVLSIIACGSQRDLLTPTTPASTTLVIYDDTLSVGWQDWSWNSTVTTNNATLTHSGTASMAVTYDQGWAGLSLRAPSAIDTSSFTAIDFWVHGGATGTRTLQFFIQERDNGGESPVIELDAPAGEWTQITIALVALGNPTTLARLNLQDRSGAAQPVFYVDDIRLVADSTTPPPVDNVTITLATDGIPRPIDARVLGTNLPTWLGPGRLANTTFRARTSASGVTVIRMPGGSWSNHYGWLSCEMGIDQPNALLCGDNWGSWAAKPTDFIDFLQATGIEGMWVVSNNGTPQEAAAAVAFFNAMPDDNTLIGVDRNGFDWRTAGHWAQLRTDNGNPQPLGIKLWSVGNEIYGGRPSSGGAECQPWGWEDVWSCDGTEYVNGAKGYDGYTTFRNAMRAIDATIQVGAVGVTPSSDYNNWGNEVIAAAGATMDFYDIHQYGFFEAPADNTTLLAAPQSAWPTIMGNVRTTFANHANGRAIPVGVTEYNLFAVQDQDNGQQMTRAVNALYIADTIGQMISEGVVMANQWDLANGRASNGTEYGLMHEDNNWYRSPQYYLFPLWARFGTELLPTTNTLDAATQLSVYGGRIDANTYSLLAINKRAQAVMATIGLNGAEGPLSVTGGTEDVLQAASLAAQTVTYNNVNDPADDLSDAPSRTLTIASDSLTHTFAPYSVTLLRLQVGNAPPQATATPTPTATGVGEPIATSTATATPSISPTAPSNNTGLFLPLVTR